MIVSVSHQNFSHVLIVYPS